MYIVTAKKPLCEVLASVTVYKDKVNLFLNKKYFTISPDIRRFKNMKECCDVWETRINKALYLSCRDYVFTLELAGGIRPHYHGICDVKDKVGFAKKFFKMSQHDNVKVHKEFKDGFDYIVKEIEETYDSVTGSVLFSHSLHSEAMQLRRQKLKELRLDEKALAILPPVYPRWMLE